MQAGTIGRKRFQICILNAALEGSYIIQVEVHFPFNKGFIYLRKKLPAACSWLDKYFKACSFPHQRVRFETTLSLHR